MSEIKIILRPVQPEDHNYLMATWINGLWRGLSKPDIPEGMTEKEVYQDLCSYIANKLSPAHHYGPATIQIACGDHDPNWIAGYSVSRGPHLEWLYVKKDYRRQGIANLLLQRPPHSDS